MEGARLPLGPARLRRRHLLDLRGERAAGADPWRRPIALDERPHQVEELGGDVHGGQQALEPGRVRRVLLQLVALDRPGGDAHRPTELVVVQIAEETQDPKRSRQNGIRARTRRRASGASLRGDPLASGRDRSGAAAGNGRRRLGGGRRCRQLPGECRADQLLPGESRLGSQQLDLRLFRDGLRAEAEPAFQPDPPDQCVSAVQQLRRIAHRSRHPTQQGHGDGPQVELVGRNGALRQAERGAQPTLGPAADDPQDRQRLAPIWILFDPQVHGSSPLDKHLLKKQVFAASRTGRAGGIRPRVRKAAQ